MLNIHFLSHNARHAFWTSNSNTLSYKHTSFTQRGSRCDTTGAMIFAASRAHPSGVWRWAHEPTGFSLIIFKAHCELIVSKVRGLCSTLHIPLILTIKRWGWSYCICTIKREKTTSTSAKTDFLNEKLICAAKIISFSFFTKQCRK